MKTTAGYFLWQNIKETEKDSPNKGYNVTFAVSSVFYCLFINY